MNQTYFEDGHQECWKLIEGTSLWRKIKDCNCEFPQQQKCKNYEVCGNINPLMGIYDAFNGFCEGCCHFSSKFGLKGGRKFEKTQEVEECPICREELILYKMLNCSHKFCASCLKDSHYPNYGKIEDYPEDPGPFPHPDDEEEGYYPDGEFLDNPEDEKWKDDEEVKEWYRKYKNLEECKEKNIKLKRFGKCGYCREDI